MPRILLFISTGRSGTQFITELLAQSAGDRAIVTHEPLGAQYKPRKYLRAANLSGSLGCEPVIRDHFESWDVALGAGKSIIETGWPIFPWLPYIAKRYDGHVDIVHVVRNPIRFAFSQASHGYYSRKREDEYTELAALLPTDSGVKHKDYEEFWPELNRVERCLFQWLEINDYAEELSAQGLISKRYRSEDVFLYPDKFLDDMRKLDVVWAEVLLNVDISNKIVDNFNSTLSELISSVRYTEAVSRLAQQYGYSLDLNCLNNELVSRFYVGQRKRMVRSEGLIRRLSSFVRLGGKGRNKPF